MSTDNLHVRINSLPAAENVEKVVLPMLRGSVTVKACVNASRLSVPADSLIEVVAGDALTGKVVATFTGATFAQSVAEIAAAKEYAEEIAATRKSAKLLSFTSAGLKAAAAVAAANAAFAAKPAATDEQPAKGKGK